MPCLALDWGASRIGVASSSSDSLATPLCILTNDDDLFDRLGAIIDEHRPDRVVVGLPAREYETPETRRIREFADSVAQRWQIPVELWDESYSSLEAESKTSRRGRRRKRPEPIDDRAAAVILQSWLDAGGMTR